MISSDQNHKQSQPTYFLFSDQAPPKPGKVIMAIANQYKVTKQITYISKCIIHERPYGCGDPQKACSVN